MNKLFNKIAALSVGLAMAIGVGVAIGGGDNGVRSVKAETLTYSFTINGTKFNTTSYAANNNEKTSTAVCTSDSSKTMDVKWTSYQVMKSGDNMQWQKSKGYIYNSTDLGTIKSVTVNSSAGSFTNYYGTSEHPTSGTTVGNGYFTVAVGGATGTTSSIVVTFEKDSGGVTPTLTGISVETAPTTTVYTAGETFDPTGLVINRTYSDSSYNDTYAYAGHTSEFTFTPSTSTALTTSDASVTIGYGGQTTTQAITVNAPSWTNTTGYTDGGSYFIFDGTYYLRADNSTQPERVTSQASATVFTITLVGNNTFTFVSDSKYLYATNTNNGVRFGDSNTTNNKWLLESVNSSFTFKEIVNSRYLTSTSQAGTYSNGDWRAYTSAPNSFGETELVLVPYVAKAVTVLSVSPNTWSGYTSQTIDVSDYTVSVTTNGAAGSTDDYTFQGIGSGSGDQFVARVANFSSGSPETTDTRLQWKANYPTEIGGSTYLYTYVSISASEDSVTSITASVNSGTYYAGEKLTASDFSVTATWASGLTTYPTSDFTWTVGGVADDELDIGSNTVVVTYSGQSSENITVTTSGYRPGTEDNPYTAADILSVFDYLEQDENNGAEIYVQGTIVDDESLTVSSGRGRFNITSGGETVYVYNVNGFTNINDLTSDDIPAGSRVVLKGAVKNYSGSLQICYVKNVADCCLITVEKPVTDLIIDVENNELSISSSDLTSHTVNVMIDEDAFDQKVNITHQSGTNGLFTVNTNQITCVSGEGSFTVTGTGATTGSETFRISSNSNPTVYVDLVVEATDIVYNSVTISISGYHLSGTTEVVQGEDIDVNIIAEAKYVLPETISVLDDNNQAISEEWTYSKTDGELIILELSHNVHISFSPVAADSELVLENPKTDFTEGDEFSTGNLVVYRVYEDASTTTEVIPLWDGEDENSGYKVDSSDFDSSTPGTYEIVITYKGLSETYDVTVTGIVHYTFQCADTITKSDTGVSGTAYTGWGPISSDTEGVTGINSRSTYEGNSAGPASGTGAGAIQLRSSTSSGSNVHSGIVTTVSGGKAVKVTIAWNKDCAAGRVIDVYGSNSAYESADDLYATGTQGTKLGSITQGSTTELTITGDYTFIGIRSSSGAIYIDSVSITWSESIAAAADVEEVNDFIELCMHTEIAPSVQGTGSCKDSGWYDDAKDYFDDLTPRQKAIILTSTSYALTDGDNVWYYNQIKERLQAWARANGETFNVELGTFSRIKVNSIFGTTAEETNNILIITIVAIVSVTAVGGYFLLKKKKTK